MRAESTPEIPAGDVERYHAAAVELADEARRSSGPPLSAASPSSENPTGRWSRTSTARSSVGCVS